MAATIPWQPVDCPAALLRAIADPLRRRAVHELARSPMRVGELARRLGIPRANLSHHLRVLADAGLVVLRRGQATVRAEALVDLRRYFDRALTVAVVTSSDGQRLWRA